MLSQSRPLFITRVRENGATGVAFRAVRELALLTQWWLQGRTRKRSSQETVAR